jgi:N-methylhydantoinase B
MRSLTDASWSLSAMIDRTRHAASGLAGGQPGAVGAFTTAQHVPLPPKTVLSLEPAAAVRLDLPGGGGYGEPSRRDPARVLDDVVNGYVSVDAAAVDYGVVIRYLGAPDQLVRLPEHYAIDADGTHALRAGTEWTE